MIINKNINNSCNKLLHHLDYQHDFLCKIKEKVLFIKIIYIIYYNILYG